MRKPLKTVYLYGRTDAAYRPAIWASYFLNRPTEYAILLDTGGAASGLPKLVRVVLRIIHHLYAYLVSDIVIIQPMQHATQYARLIYKLNRIVKKVLFVDVYISQYETLVCDRKRYSEGSAEALRLKAFDRLAFIAGRPTVFLTQAERAYYSEVLNLDSKKLQTITIPLVTEGRPLARRPYLSGLVDIPTIAWWGREGNPLHGVENIAEACRILLREGFQARFAFFASGDQDWASFCQQFRDLREHPNVIFSKDHSFNNGRLSDFLKNETDLALGTFGNTRKAKTVLVNKVLDAAAFGIPCLTQNSLGLSEFFDDHETILLSETEPHALAARIREVLQKPDDLKRVGENARAKVGAVFSPQGFHRALVQILAQ